jgi:hypothetical protein
MKSIIKVLLSISFIALFFSCAQSSYVEKTYPPTTNVDLYLEEEGISRQYDLMGHITVDGSDIISADKLRKK